jgi:hypothetical protein
MPTFSTPQPITVVVELEVGTAHVTASDRADSVVEVRPTDPSRDADVRAAEQTQVDFSSGRLEVRTPKQRGLLSFGRSPSVELRIDVPTGSALQGTAAAGAFVASGRLGASRLKTGAGDVVLERVGPLVVRTGLGDVRVAGVEGDAEVTTGSGEVVLGSVAGSLEVKNHNGRTTVGDVGGSLRVKAANGDIAAGRVGSDVAASSANGTVRVEEVVRGAARLKTAMGSIELGVGPGSAALLDAHTSFGCIRNQLDRVDGPARTDSSVEVHARTSMGDIVIRRAPERVPT